MKDASSVVAVDCQIARARTKDRDALAHGEKFASKRDRAGDGEVDRVAVVCGGQRLAQ